MYCPNCGNQSAQQQKYCRSCGLNLQAVTEAVAEHSGGGASADSSNEQAPGELQLVYQMAGLGMIMFFFGAVIACAGIVLHEDGVKVLGALVAIAGIVLPFYLRFSIARLQALNNKRSSPKTLPSVDTNRALPPERFAEAVSSIAEQTTGLLEPQPAGARKRSGELSA